MDDYTLSQAQDFVKFKTRLEACWRAMVAKEMDVMIDECEPFSYYGPFVGVKKGLRFIIHRKDHEEYLGDLHWPWDHGAATYHDLTEGKNNLALVPLFEGEEEAPEPIHALALQDLERRLQTISHLWGAQRKAWEEKGVNKDSWAYGTHMSLEGELSLTAYGEDGEFLVEILLAAGEAEARYVWPEATEKA